MNVLHLDKTSFISLMEHILDIGVERVAFSQNSPQPEGPASRLSAPSIDIPLSGVKHMRFAYGGEIRDSHLLPGEIHFAAERRWKRPLWDTPHEMSSIVCHSDFIRFTYINNAVPDSLTAIHPAADIYYHTSTPLPIQGQSMLSVLKQMGDTGENAGAPAAMKALLEISLETLRRDKTAKTGKAERTWLAVNQYLREHFDSPINRAHVATLFKLHPGYLTRLFKRMGKGFNETLRDLRLDHAAHLLKETDLEVKEICEACGYLSDTYFISAFKKRFGAPPGEYRCGGGARGHAERI